MLIAFSLILLLLSVFLGSPVVALGLGISLSIIFNVHQDFYTKKIGTRLLQTGIILMGLSINFVDALTVTKIYLPAISIFVLLVFVLGLIIGKIIGIDKRFSLLIAAGTAICGGTAMAAITPIIKAKPEDLAAGISIIFILNAFGIIFFPMIGQALNLSELQFGAWVATAIHDTSAVIGASLNYGPYSVETAATLKLTRTLWLIPLMIMLAFGMKSEEKKIQFPVFVIFFIIAIILGSFIDLPFSSMEIKKLSQVFLLLGLFSVGSQISRDTLKNFTSDRLIFATSLWLLVIPISYFLVNVIKWE